MPVRQFPTRLGMLLSPRWSMDMPVSLGTSVMDAAGEGAGMVGHLFLEGGPGTSKTISSAGGKIHWRSGGSITFANAGTTLRVGIQDVNASGLEDGSFDVSGDLVGGTDVVASSDLNTTAMGTGSKTIAHGDLVAFRVEMVSRAGADSVTLATFSLGSALPYGIVDTGSSAKSTSVTICTVEFDDGTVGWFFPCYALPGSLEGPTTTAFGSGSTPDERALIFRLPFPAQIQGAMVSLGNYSAADDLEVILYSNPLGTPVAEQAVAVDATFVQPTANTVHAFFASPPTLKRNTDYAIAVRPTTVNTLSTREFDFSTVPNLRRATPLGTNWYLGTRTNQTGPFSPTSTTIPHFGMYLSAFHDGQVSDYLSL